jgi:hypothetical protein
MDPGINQRKCPVCAGEEAEGPEVTSDPPAEELPLETLRSYWSGFFKEKIFFSYYRCSDCKLLFCKYYLDVPKLGELYQQMSDNTAGVSVDCLKKSQENYFKILQKHSPPAGNFMELGPDIGLFTDFCVKEGNFSHFWLFEPNQAVHPQLREVVKGKSHTLSTEMMNYGEIPDQSLSLVVMVHVLDHLLAPKQVLEKFYQKMKPGAILMAVSHDESSWLAKFMKHRWPPYCLQHPQLFNPSSIKTLMEIDGYKILEITKTYNYFPALYLLKHAFWAAGIRGISIPDTNLLKIPLKLGNIITIASKKE